jgi:malate dehydrogenase (oxaloacetate-decarboxylating)
LNRQEALGRFYGVDVHGLLVEGITGIRPEQAPFCRRRSDVEGWKVKDPEDVSFNEVVHNAKPTVLIGVSGKAGIFTEDVVRDMAKNTERPIIFPLSNPTSKSEGIPEQFLDWTDGRALIGTGSPFDPVNRNGKQVRIYQVNNSYTFPGLALGIISSRAKHVSDEMIKAAARALADLSPTAKDPKGDLLPPLAESRANSMAIARAVGKQAIRDRLSEVKPEALEEEICANVWDPVYRPYKHATT